MADKFTKIIPAIIGSGDVIELWDGSLIQLVSDKNGRVRARIKCDGDWTIHRAATHPTKKKR